MVKISRYLRARAVKAERSRCIRAISLEEALELMTRSQEPCMARGLGRAGSSGVDDGCAEHLGFLVIL